MAYSFVTKPHAFWSYAMAHRHIRRGVSTVQFVVLAALVILAVVCGVTLLGTRANTKLDQTATDVADPASLVNRFGSGGSGS
jgi:Flp pilus assembly pilin Flp